MFKLQLQWNKEGDWLDTIWHMPYAEAYVKWFELSETHPDHRYRMIPTGRTM